MSLSHVTKLNLDSCDCITIVRGVGEKVTRENLFHLKGSRPWFMRGVMADQRRQAIV